MTNAEIDYLSVEDLLEIAAGVVDEVVVRDAGLLAAAAGRPRVTVFGDDAYPTFQDMAAALLHSLVRNHALVDGNRRQAWSATRIICLLNGRDLAYTVDDAEDLILSAAAGQLDVAEISDWLAAHLRAAPWPPVRPFRSAADQWTISTHGLSGTDRPSPGFPASLRRHERRERDRLLYEPVVEWRPSPSTGFR